MKWRVVSPQHCIFAKRVASIAGLDYSDQADGAEAALFIEMFSDNLIKATRFDGPRILWWTGTDARQYVGSPNNFYFQNTVHVTDTPWLIYSLSTKVFPVCFLPMPCSIDSDPLPYPSDPAILMYLNQHVARDIERSKQFIDYHRAHKIYVMCGLYNEPLTDLGNYDHLIHVDRVPDDQRLELFKKIGVYIRFMHFDGMSQLTIEMKYLGKHVVTSEFVPYAEIVDDEDSVQVISERIRGLINHPPNPAGTEWYRKIFSIDTFNQVLSSIGESRGWGRITNG